MRRFISTIDRWGPALVSVLALFVVCGISWAYAERIARVEGKLDAQQQELNRRVQLEIALRTEIQTWQAYVVVLQRTMVENGITNVPKPPNPLISTQKENPNGRRRMQGDHQ